ncbi:sphingolipid long chain base-responsive protein PIL1 [Ascosphaera apis ARSEF 7405]|uniref:Sphingolipid long chain base-responsive protein PIL1 n=1 Tax=Ascosphaera apis ARSEF 7405 TaxID=392613 RepID=A0A167Y0L1_9EURO|nr:sphingolipid long chain base-responsive protein PIL1 [Ascosphaera apis ARSEF 7405]
MATLCGIQQPELSKRLFRIIKTENHAIDCYENAARDRVSIASQLSDWGDYTGDSAISDLSDKLGVLLAEIGEQEDLYAQNLDDYRNLLKHVRNTEASVQPTRDYKSKVIEQIQKEKIRDPNGQKLISLEQELVRAEAQSLVAEAQLTNITRQKFKEAFDLKLAATIERAEKQIILARHGRRLLNLLDDSPLVPGDSRPEYENVDAARRILDDAEHDLRSWEPSLEPVHSSAGDIGTNLMPQAEGEQGQAAVAA